MNHSVSWISAFFFTIAFYRSYKVLQLFGGSIKLAVSIHSDLNNSHTLELENKLQLKSVEMRDPDIQSDPNRCIKYSLIIDLYFESLISSHASSS